MAAKRILLIEDEAGAREAMASLLTEEGYQVRTAETAARGLAELYDFRPDTVVCDVLLPDSDGLEVLRHVRRTMGSGVVFIVLTAGCGSEAAERALQREADLFLRKPMDLARLRRALEQTGPRRTPAAARA